MIALTSVAIDCPEHPLCHGFFICSFPPKLYFVLTVEEEVNVGYLTQGARAPHPGEEGEASPATPSWPHPPTLLASSGASVSPRWKLPCPQVLPVGMLLPCVLTAGFFPMHSAASQKAFLMDGLAESCGVSSQP